jgi:hypothetical protein
MGGLNNPTLCVNGKFTTNGSLSVLTSYGISTTSSGLNISQPMEIYNSGEYAVELETTGSLTVYLDGEMIANINASSEPYARFNVTVEKGFHKFNIVASANSVMALTVSDDSNTKFFNSRLWCDNTSTVVCPVSGFTNYENICERATSKYCENGEYDETIKKCIVEPKCVLLGTGPSFEDQDQSIKVEYFEDASVRFMCSPLTCVDNFCQTATCPDPSIGTDVEITASEREEAGGGDLCLDQECDANLNYYNLCGIQGSCDTSRKDVVVKGEYPDEKCFEKYCDEGYFDPNSGKCKVLRCPSNTEENAEGNCVRI